MKKINENLDLAIATFVCVGLSILSICVGLHRMGILFAQ